MSRRTKLILALAWWTTLALIDLSVFFYYGRGDVSVWAAAASFIGCCVFICMAANELRKLRGNPR